MTQILAVIQPDNAYLASDSLWNCAALGRANFLFRKVYSFGDHLLAACGHGAAISMILEIGLGMPELHAGEHHQAIGEAIAKEWATYVHTYRSELVASNAAQSFIVLSRQQPSFQVTEWFGAPGNFVVAHPKTLKARDVVVLGPLVSLPGSRTADPYQGVVRRALGGVLKPAVPSGALVESALACAIHASVRLASTRGGVEAGFLGLPMTGWHLPLSGPPNPLGDPKVGGLDADPRGQLHALLADRTSDPKP